MMDDNEFQALLEAQGCSAPDPADEDEAWRDLAEDEIRAIRDA